MYLQIKKAELQKNNFGQDIKITMIGLYDDTGKWIRRVKLNDATIDCLLKGRFYLDDNIKNG